MILFYPHQGMIPPFNTAPPGYGNPTAGYGLPNQVPMFKKLLSSSLTLGQIRRLMSSVGSAESNRRFNLRPREHLAYFHNLQ